MTVRNEGWYVLAVILGLIGLMLVMAQGLEP